MNHESANHPLSASIGKLTSRPLALAISSLLLSGALAGTVEAQVFPAVVKLTELDGSSGFRLDGLAEYDYSGLSVSGAGDINGDGIDDLVIGALGADPNGSASGSSYVVFGRNVSVAGDFPALLDLSSLDGSTGFRIDGAAQYDYAGISVSAAGDINGDGIDDLIIGASGAGPNGSTSGSSYVVFGRNVPFPAILALSSLDGSTGFRLDGVAAGDRSGFSVSAAGDINGDGVDDLIIGALNADPNGSASGSSYVVFGRNVSAEGNFLPTLALSSLDGSTGFRIDGEALDDYSGHSVSAAGDINGDGIDDLVIGAWGATPAGNISGSSYVVFGRNVSAEGNFLPSLTLSSLNGSNGFRLDGAAAGDRSGYSVSAAGDINGDGVDDLIIGAYDADPGGNTASGSSYVVFGRNVSAEGNFLPTLALSSLDGSTGFRIDGEALDDYSGHSVSAAGDINGDGVDDLIIGAHGADPDGNNSAGSSYVVFGRNVSAEGNFLPTLALSSLDGSTGFRLDGVAENDLSGFSVSAAGDINGDGIDDLVIGAFGATPAGNNSGSSYVVFGGGTSDISDVIFASGFETN